MFGTTELLVILCTIYTVSSLDKVKLDADGNFIDNAGAKLVFHGINSVFKQHPWYPDQMLNRTRLALYRDWGINAVRLGVMWSGVMPTRDKVDDSYLDKIRQIVVACDEFDIYVLFDMHQDILSSLFSGYDGIPLWLAKDISNPPEEFKYPWPYREQPKEWYENYLTYACLDCAENLYKNESGALTYWGDFWSTVADRFVGFSNVIGYELINEPPPANLYKTTKHGLSGYVGEKLLLPAYDYLVQRIRKSDKETLIFYEPLTYGVFMSSSVFDMGTGFNHVPGGLLDPTEKFKAVLSYHYYCWILQTANPSRDLSFFEQLICDEMLMPNVFENSAKSVVKTGGGRFLTEFGLCAPDGNPNSINTIECNKVMQMADEQVQSWMYWDGDFIDSNGHPITTQLQSFSRAYPFRTLGEELKYSFNPTSGNFDFKFQLPPMDAEQDLSVAEVYLPVGVHYPGGVDIQLEPVELTHALNGSRLHLYLPRGSRLFTSQLVSLIVRKI